MLRRLKRLLSKSGPECDGGPVEVASHADVRTGWLRPDGSGVVLGLYEHGQALAELGVTWSKAWRDGWVRKAGDHAFEFDGSSDAALSMMNRHLKALYDQDRIGDNVFMDVKYSGGQSYAVHYRFSKKNFRRECYDVRNIISEERYRI